MGVCYETCAISNLPIKYEDEVLVFFIQKRKHIYKEWAGKGNSDAWYRPIDFPVQAVCNIDEQFDCESQEDSEKIASYRGGNVEQHEVMFVLKEMYDLVMEEMSVRNDMRIKFNQYIDDFIASVDNEMTQEQKRNDYFWVGCLDMLTDNNPFINFVYGCGMEMRQLLKPLYETKNVELREKMLNLMIFQYSLDVMRKMWHPGVGRGSQDSEYYLYRKLAERVIQKE